MSNIPKINPTAPPPLYISPPLIPVAVATPTIHYSYIIKKRLCYCYLDLFLLQKKPSKWKLTMTNEKNSYELPLSKSNNDIKQILMSLGIETNALYKVEVYSKDIRVNSRFFVSLSSLVEFIIENERVIEGVVFC